LLADYSEPAPFHRVAPLVVELGWIARMPLNLTLLEVLRRSAGFQCFEQCA
jgi:hypothetical protein